jgi:hypothetical protein
MQKHGASGCWTGNFLQALTSQHSERGVVLANLLRRFFEAFNFPVPPACTDNLNAGVAMMKSAQDGA